MNEANEFTAGSRCNTGMSKSVSNPSFRIENNLTIQSITIPNAFHHVKLFCF